MKLYSNLLRHIHQIIPQDDIVKENAPVSSSHAVFINL